MNGRRSMLQIAAWLHDWSLLGWERDWAGREGGREEGCNWCAACKGMPVTPPAAKHDLPPPS